MSKTKKTHKLPPVESFPPKFDSLYTNLRISEYTSILFDNTNGKISKVSFNNGIRELTLPCPDAINKFNFRDIIMQSTTMIGSIIAFKPTTTYGDNYSDGVSFMLLEQKRVEDVFNIIVVISLKIDNTYIKKQNLLNIVFSNINNFWVILKEDNGFRLVYYYSDENDAKSSASSSVPSTTPKPKQEYIYTDMVIKGYRYLTVISPLQDITPSVIYILALDKDDIVVVLQYAINVQIPNMPMIELFYEDNETLRNAGKYISYCINTNIAMFSIIYELPDERKCFYTGIVCLTKSDDNLKTGITLEYSKSILGDSRVSRIDAYRMAYTIMQKTEDSILEEEIKRDKEALEKYKKKKAAEDIELKAKAAAAMADKLIAEEIESNKSKSSKKAKAKAISPSNKLSAIDKEKLAKQKEIARLEAQRLRAEELDREHKAKQKVIDEELAKARIAAHRLELQQLNEKMLEKQRLENAAKLDQQRLEQQRLETLEHNNTIAKDIINYLLDNVSNIIDSIAHVSECFTDSIYVSEESTETTLPSIETPLETSIETPLELEDPQTSSICSLSSNELKLSEYTTYYKFIYYMSMINPELANELTYAASNDIYKQLLFINREIVMKAIDILVINHQYILNVKNDIIDNILKADSSINNVYDTYAIFGSYLSIIYSIALNEIGYDYKPYSNISQDHPFNMVDIDTISLKITNNYYGSNDGSNDGSINDMSHNYKFDEFIKEQSVAIGFHTATQPIQNTKIKTASIETLLRNSFDINATAAILIYEESREPYVRRNMNFTEFLFGYQQIQLLYPVNCLRDEEHYYDYKITKKRFIKAYYKWYGIRVVLE